MPIKDPNEDPIASGSGGQGCLIAVLAALAGFCLLIFLGSVSIPSGSSSENMTGLVLLVVVLQYWPLILLALLAIIAVVIVAVARAVRKKD